jgi:hypothetical protein
LRRPGGSGRDLGAHGQWYPDISALTISDHRHVCITSYHRSGDREFDALYLGRHPIAGGVSPADRSDRRVLVPGDSINDEDGGVVGGRDHAGGTLRFALSIYRVRRDAPQQSGIARTSKHIFCSAFFAAHHQLVAAEAPERAGAHSIVSARSTISVFSQRSRLCAWDYLICKFPYTQSAELIASDPVGVGGIFIVSCNPFQSLETENASPIPAQCNELNVARTSDRNGPANVKPRSVLPRADLLSNRRNVAASRMG